MCSPSCLPARDPPASDSLLLGSRACTTMLDSTDVDTQAPRAFFSSFSWLTPSPSVFCFLLNFFFRIPNTLFIHGLDDWLFCNYFFCLITFCLGLFVDFLLYFFENISSIHWKALFPLFALFSLHKFLYFTKCIHLMCCWCNFLNMKSFLIVKISQIRTQLPYHHPLPNTRTQRIMGTHRFLFLDLAESSIVWRWVTSCQPLNTWISANINSLVPVSFIVRWMCITELGLCNLCKVVFTISRSHW